jgi:hypothetical protein
MAAAATIASATAGIAYILNRVIIGASMRLNWAVYNAVTIKYASKYLLGLDAARLKPLN